MHPFYTIEADTPNLSMTTHYSFNSENISFNVSKYYDTCVCVCVCVCVEDISFAMCRWAWLLGDSKTSHSFLVRKATILSLSFCEGRLGSKDLAGPAFLVLLNLCLGIQSTRSY